MFPIGPLLIGLASLIWGSGYVLWKIALTSVEPIVLTTYAYLVAVLAFGLVKEVRTEGYCAFCQTPWRYVLLGSCGGIAAWAFSYGLAHLPLTIAALVERIQPVVVVGLARIFLGEKFPLAKAPWGIIAIAAAYALVVEDPLSFQLESHITIDGLLAIIAASMVWALAGIVGKTVLNTSSSYVVTAIRTYIGLGIMLFPLGWQVGVKGWSVLVISPLDAGLIVVAAMTSNVLAYVLFYQGLKTTGVGVASFIELITPVSSVGLGVVFLNEHLDWLHQGCAVVLLGAVLLVSKTSPAEQAQPLEPAAGAGSTEGFATATPPESAELSPCPESSTPADL